nr:type IX secretion system sortase PorU [Cytophagales bacterium]
TVLNRYKTYLPEKVYLDAFPQISFANGQKSPSATAAIDKAVERGSLIVNYTGHGSELGWAQEQIVTAEQINGWRNPDRLPLFVTATCEFGRYDDPETVSGAELLLLRPRTGAVGLLTTTRPVFSSTNFAVNAAFFDRVFEPDGGQMPRLGDVMRYTKNNSLSGSVNRNFALLGDPSMRLAYPVQQAVVTRINDRPFSGLNDTLKATSRVTIEGEIRNAGGVLGNFDGILQATVLDKPVKTNTLGTESARMEFVQADAVLFRGTASVRNGRFRFSFVVPKNINYTPGEGRILLYAKPTEGTADAAGVASVTVGGTATNNADNTPPQIKLFLNDSTFAPGSIVGTEALLLAHLSDENGINVSRTGIGHDLAAVLDDSLSIPLNDYFTAENDTYQRGKISFLLQNLTPGEHRITLQAWDTYNNPATATLPFTVAVKAFSIRNLRVWPNPVTESNQMTKIAFEHNRPGCDLELIIQIYDPLGRPLYTTSQRIDAAPAVVENVGLNLTSGVSGISASGVHFCRVTVRCKSETASATQRIVK